MKKIENLTQNTACVCFDFFLLYCLTEHIYRQTYMSYFDISVVCWVRSFLFLGPGFLSSFFEDLSNGVGILNSRCIYIILYSQVDFAPKRGLRHLQLSRNVRKTESIDYYMHYYAYLLSVAAAY